MVDRSYIGIDSTDNDEWIVVMCSAGKAIFSRPFKDTPTELGVLVHFISESCFRPKICLKPSNPTALKLIKYIGKIPDVEIILISDAGLKMHQAWFCKTTATPFVHNNSGHAYLLACCAERMI